MRRREFLKIAAATLACSPGAALHADAPATAAATRKTNMNPPPFDGHFLQILQGFLENARRTSDSFAVCDFAGGTLLPSCLARSGKTYVSVARMLPAIAEWMRSRRSPTRFNVLGEELDLRDVMLRFFRNAFNPEHPDYWEKPRTDRPTQRTVESALVGYALVRFGDDFVAQLSAAERANVQDWLAGCTIIPERDNNHAWFTAVNQASRLALSRKFPQFRGDEAWMIADLEALAALKAAGDDGWYSDSPEHPCFDYYNFWTFANFPLFWGKIVGELYPQWNEIFRRRVRLFLEKTPYFFAADGSYPLFGRSLVYRWAMLSPLLLGYEQKLWPHSPGLLRRIARKNLEWQWSLACFDETRGKLIETLAPEGSNDVRERYIDNGHPYWCMQSYSLLSWPDNDPFWTADEEPLPIERGDFVTRFEGPRMLLVGTQRTGQVRWLHAHTVPRRDYYRDKYSKFAYSSAFAFNSFNELGRVPWDQALVLRLGDTLDTAGRRGVSDGELTDDGLRTTWTIELAGVLFEIHTRIRLHEEFEHRRHEIRCLGEVPRGVQVLEGSYALGVGSDEALSRRPLEQGLMIVDPRGRAVACWLGNGYERLDVASDFGQSDPSPVNLLHAKMQALTCRATLGNTMTRLASLHYASPAPLPDEQLSQRALQLLQKWRDDA